VLRKHLYIKGYRTEENGNLTRMEAINTDGNSIRGNVEEIGHLDEEEANVLRRMEVDIPGPASCQMASGYVLAGSVFVVLVT
jgi:hypothetical protein